MRSEIEQTFGYNEFQFSFSAVHLKEKVVCQREIDLFSHSTFHQEQFLWPSVQNIQNGSDGPVVLIDGYPSDHFVEIELRRITLEIDTSYLL